jgi:hypothetical protein
MMGRVVVGGLVAGIVVFTWGAVSHLATPLGEMGIRQIPSEDKVVGAMKDAIREPGFYFFPGKDMTKVSESEQKAWEAKMKQGPAGILIVHPEGAEAMSPRQLGTELATNIVSAWLAALLLAQVRSGFGGRVLFVTGLGLFGFVINSVPYWNWYGFPLDYTGAQAIEKIVGWFLAGLVLAAIVRPLKGQVPA